MLEILNLELYMECIMQEMISGARTRLFFPFLESFYRCFAQPVGWLLFRVIIGGMLIVEGWPKIIVPMAQVGFIENVVGLPAGWFFSPLLAVMQFVGGGMIVLGVLTRPVAFANAVMLVVTLWYHMANPFGHAFLTPEGLAFLKQNMQYLTDQGQARLLADGGEKFLHLVQRKAEFDSLFWSASAALIAVFGGGPYSLDRKIGKEF